MTSTPADLRSAEAALLASGRVRAAAVVERPAGLRGPSDRDSAATVSASRLIAYIVADQWPRVSELRAYLTKRLPDRLVPSAFVLVEQLPAATARDGDCNALPVPSHTRPDLDVPYAPPRNPVEQVLADLWARAFGLDEVGIHDDFIDLGGDSRTAMHLLSAIEEHFGEDTPLMSIFEQPTIASFASKVFGDPGAAGRLGPRDGGS